MLIVFGLLLILASIILGLIILIQNPKGGGLSSSFGGLGNQLMGVKQTTDVLEKGTWVFATIVAVLCLTSAVFIPKATGNTVDEQLRKESSTNPGTGIIPPKTTTLPPSQQQQPHK